MIVFYVIGPKYPPKNPLYKYIMKKKSIIDIYYNEIYGIYLVVANEHVTLERLQKQYIYCDGAELNKDIMSGYCTTSRCYRKSDNAAVCLVKFNKLSEDKSIDKKLDFINTCSHEGTHVALDIYELISQNICFCSPEPFCYLQAWATERIYKTLKK